MKNMSMKNVIMGSVLAVAAVTSLSANAVTVCSGAEAKDGNPFASGTNFVKQPFTPKCSANVFMDAEEVSATVFAVGSASAKGKHLFGGSTVGGAVGNIEKCAGAACAQTDSAKGLDEAKKKS